MKRRDFLTLLSAGVMWPAVARAQQTGKVARIAYLGPTMGVPGFVIGTITRRLRELGWEEGRNLAVDQRVYGPDLGEVAPAAADFVRTRVDVIVVVSTNVARVVQTVTNAIPIVVVSGSDPVAAGVAVSLARPGGMVTGLSMMSPEMVAKRAELLVQILPHAARIAILYNPNPNTRSAPYLLEAVLPAMETLGLTHRTFPARSSEEIEPAFDAIVQWSADGVVVLDDPVLLVLRTKIAGAALARKLPVACPFREMAQAGCLLTYSASLPERFERGAAYVDKILRGANPAELPFEQPAKLELVINLITAKALGLEIPDILLAAADAVIE
jgi:putative ABC transport system substrate-binding protein